MRRTARALSAAVLASAALGVFAGPTAAADPGVPPGTADSVPCASTALTSATGDSGTVPVPSTRGAARIAAGDTDDTGDIADPAVPQEADEWSLDGDCADEAAGTGGTGGTADLRDPATVPEEGAAVEPPCPGPTARSTTPCTTTPPCPEPTAPRGATCPTKPPCPEPTGCAPAEHGVRAGTGGTFSDPAPALVAGGLLIAGACGAAVHRLRLRLRGEDG